MRRFAGMLLFLRALYFTNRFWYSLVGLIAAFCVAFIVPGLYPLVRALFFVGVGLLVIDALLLFRYRAGVFATRDVPARLSNGDANSITLYVENRYPFTIDLRLIDEIPVQFQKRDVLFVTSLEPGQKQAIRYELRPVRRGEYAFGAVNAYAAGPIGLIRRRYRLAQDRTVAVYPSFLQMRQYELMAISNRLTELGIKKIRRIGASQEFEQVRPYAVGDDVRSVNWNATARRTDAAGLNLMVNAFQEEKSQAVYCLIDKGRVMKMPFEGLSLLDYAINASLVLSNIALYKQDKAGLMTFSDTVGQVLPADRRPGQLQRILEVLYRQKTRYLETDYEALYVAVKTHLRQRSLLVLFTNFETMSALRRQLPYFRRLAQDHLLLVVFFENTELRALLDAPAQTVEEVYRKTIAEKFFYEKNQMVRELRQYGIQALLTAPADLTVNTINRYLELKARGMI